MQKGFGANLHYSKVRRFQRSKCSTVFVEIVPEFSCFFKTMTLLLQGEISLNFFVKLIQI